MAPNMFLTSEKDGGEHHGSAALSPGKYLPVPNGQEAG